MLTSKLHALRLVSKAIEQARASNFDAYESTLEQAEKELQSMEPEAAARHRLILERLQACYRRTDQSLSYPGTHLRDSPVVVVVTPALNGARFIEETISSVVSQRGKFALRYHVQDGGSTDGTVDILKTWEITLRRRNPLGGAPVRFSWSSETDGGMYDAIARGFEIACGDMGLDVAHDTLMTWVNSDDMLPLNSIWTACCFFNDHPNFSWVTGMGAIMNHAGAVARIFHEPEVFSQLDLAAGRHDGRRLRFVQQEGTYWRRTLWARSGGISRNMKLAGDWDLWRRFACVEPLIKLRTLLGLHRRHRGQLSANIHGYYAEMDATSLEPADRSDLSPKGIHAAYDTESLRWVLTEVVTDSEIKTTGEEAKTQQSDASSEVLGPASPSHTPATLPGNRQWPKISVITPSFNQGRYISETIQSVVSQGYPNLEYIVVDGGSTDETIEILNRNRSHFTHLITERDRGQSDALNKGFKLATGEIFCWLNSDDQFVPGALFSIAMAFCTNDVDMVSGICEIYQDGALRHRHMTACADGRLPLNDLLDLDNGWNAGQFFYQPEVFFSRAIWEKAGSHVREDCYYSMDYELWCRFAFHGARLHVIGKPLARFRQHADQKTADPSKFKAELVTVRDRFLAAHEVQVSPSGRPPVLWDRTLRVAIVNDIGPLHGAGIAQSRLAAGIEMAGHTLEWFSLAWRRETDPEDATAKLIEEMIAYGPDVVLFGNLHARSRDSVSLIEAMSSRFPTFWVLHDFWLLTGRCAYVGSCDRYLRGCDETCPTPSEYPNLDPARIHRAWQRKQQLITGSHPPVILANSAWTLQFAADALRNLGIRGQGHVAQIRLGAPVNLFRNQSRTESRIALGLDPDAFVVAFSASSARDERKGATYLLGALRGIQIPKLSILVLGDVDRDSLNIEGADVVSLGYISDITMVVGALSAADVYVGPSTAETFGQVFIEAALTGIPSIGFDQTGVRDSIANGITGLRVEQSVQALREAIKRLHDDTKLRADLAGWGPVFAANEFSLELSYHSLFNVWRSLGLVDKWGLPHKVGFVRSSRFVDDTLGSIPAWQPVEGISSVEGPYPADEIPTPFRWCHGEVTSIRVNCSDGGPYLLRVAYYCNLFDSLRVRVAAAGQPAVTITLIRTTGGIPAFATIPFDGHPGWNRVELRPERVREPGGGETRALSFMLKEIDVSKQTVPVEPGLCMA